MGNNNFERHTNLKYEYGIVDKTEQTTGLAGGFNSNLDLPNIFVQYPTQGINQARGISLRYQTFIPKRLVFLPKTMSSSIIADYYATVKI